MISRSFSAPIDISTPFTTQIDVFEILAGVGKPVQLAGFEIGQTSEVGDAQEEILILALKYLTGVPTSGSGGGTSTARPLQPGDVIGAGTDTAAATIETGNTTKLTGGTSVTIKRFAWNVRTPLLYLPFPDTRFVLPEGNRLVLELLTTPADSIAGLQGWIDIQEPRL